MEDILDNCEAAPFLPSNKSDPRKPARLHEDEEAGLLPNDQQDILLPPSEEAGICGGATLSPPTPPRKSFSKTIRDGFKIENKKQVILIIIALFLTFLWFEYIIFLKQDHDKVKLQLSLINTNPDPNDHTNIQPSFIQVPPPPTRKNPTIQPDLDQHIVVPSDEEIKQQSNTSNEAISEDEEDEDRIVAADPPLELDLVTMTNWDLLTIIKPKIDDKTYKLKKLPNGLKVLLISDSSATQSIAVLDVLVGSWTDPVAGLSHFLEHMKFQATNEFLKHPNALDDFLSDNQGFSNAFTDSENTNYHLSVNPNGFEDTLKIFANMFINNSYPRENVLKEINAVNSEYINSISNDDWKNQFLLSALAREGHPFKNFTCGSAETLADESIDILKILTEYDHTRYSSHLMSLILSSNHPISELEYLLEKSQFTDIPNKNNYTRVFEDRLPFEPEQLGKFYKIRATNLEEKEFSIFVQYRTQELNKRSDYEQYFRDVLLNSSPGGFQQILREKQYISTIGFGRYIEVHSYSIFMLTLSLTDSGFANLDDLLRLYYSFVTQFAQKFDAKNFAKKGAFNDVLFSYDPNDNLTEDVLSFLGSKLNTIENPTTLFIQNNYKYHEQSHFKQFITPLTNPLQAIFVLKSTQFDESELINSKLFTSINNTFSQTHDIFKIEYDLIATLDQAYVDSLLKISPDQQEEEEEPFLYTLDLTLAPNPKIQFYNPSADNAAEILSAISLAVNTNHYNQLDSTVSVDFSSNSENYSIDPYTVENAKTTLTKFAFSTNIWNTIINADKSLDLKSYPLQLIDSKSTRSFFMMDFEMAQPQSIVLLRLSNANTPIFTDRQQALTNVFLQAQSQFIQENFAQAILSKYELQLASSSSDIQIQVSGWKDGFDSEMQQFIQAVQSHVPTESEWRSAKENLLSGIEREIAEMLLFKRFMKLAALPLLSQDAYSYQKRIEEITAIDTSMIQEGHAATFTHTNLDVLFTGNISPTEAISATHTIEGLFEFVQADNDSLKKVLQITDFTGKNYIYRDTNSQADDENSVTINIYQIGKRSLDEMIYASLLSSKMDRFFYETLRTKQQLGYIAAARFLTTECVDHVFIVLQGNKYQPHVIDGIIESAFVDLETEINAITEEEFKSLLAGQRTLFEKLPASLAKKTEFMWTQIAREKFDFDISLYALNAIDTRISLQGYKDFFAEHFKINASKFSFQLYSQIVKSEEQVPTVDAPVTPFADNLKKQQPILVTDAATLNASNQNKFHECHYSL